MTGPLHRRPVGRAAAVADRLVERVRGEHVEREALRVGQEGDAADPVGFTARCPLPALAVAGAAGEPAPARAVPSSTRATAAAAPTAVDGGPAGPQPDRQAGQHAQPREAPDRRDGQHREARHLDQPGDDARRRAHLPEAEQADPDGQEIAGPASPREYPAPAPVTSQRPVTSAAAASTKPAMTWSRNSVPMVGMVR